MKKYELTNETKIVDGVTLYRIKALRDFGNVKKGDLGGFVEKEDNLSHDGNCWIYNNACQYGNSRRTDNAKSFHNVKSFGNSQQSGNSEQSGNSWQYGNSKQYGNSWQYGDSQQYGNSRQYGNSWQSGDSWQYGNSRQSGDSVSKKYNDINLINLSYNITISDNYIMIGCKAFDFKTWYNFSDEEIKEMDENALDFWKKYKSIIFEIIKNERGCEK